MSASATPSPSGDSGNAVASLQKRPNRLLLLVPLILLALVSATVGAFASRTVKPVSPPLFFALFFSGVIYMKVWLTTAAIVLACAQLLTAARIYERLHFPPMGRFYNFVHRWSGRTAIAITLPVAYHCVFLLGYASVRHGDPFDFQVVRTMTHATLGTIVYGVFLGKLFIVRASGLPGWLLPLAGATLFTVLLGLWITSSLWFFTAVSLSF
jgi:Family of unknown function (DUF6529)